MEPNTAPSQRRHVPWQGLLLAVLMLSIWMLSTTAQMTCETKPPSLVERKDVLFLVNNVPKRILFQIWFKGNEPHKHQLIGAYDSILRCVRRGPLYTGREQIYPNGSMLIRNVTRANGGTYTFVAQTRSGEKTTIRIQLQVVYGPSTPTFSISNSHYHIGETINLTCHAESNPPAEYYWMLNGKFLLVGEELIIQNISERYRGTYTCLAYNAATEFYKTTAQTIKVYKYRKLAAIQPATPQPHSNISGGIMNNSADHKDPVWREDAGDYQEEVSNTVLYNKSDMLHLNVK